VRKIRWWYVLSFFASEFDVTLVKNKLLSEVQLDFLIDGLQYANWSEKIFKQMRKGNVDAVHVTITYHENFRETVLQIEKWNRFFEQFPDLIFHGRTAEDIKLAKRHKANGDIFWLTKPFVH
jgi:hypothetical protein